MLATGPTDPLRMVFERVASAHPAAATFDGLETKDWPEGALGMLLSLRLLTETGRASSITCPGCEAECHKPVVVRPFRGSSIPRAFVTCDEEPDYGRVPVSMFHVARFQSSFVSTAQFASRYLELMSAEQITGGRILLGVAKGRHGPRDVALVMRDRRLVVTIGDQVESLCRLLSWSDVGPTLDRGLLCRLSNRKERREIANATKASSRNSKSSGAPPQSRRNQEILRCATQLKGSDANKTRIAEKIARMPFIAKPRNDLKRISAATVRRILANLMRD